MLLDTGLRASELCELKLGDVDLKAGRVEAKHGLRGGAKGGKGRTVFLGKTARRFVWRYLAECEDGEDPEAFLFFGRWDRPMNPDSLRQLLKFLAKKAACTQWVQSRRDSRISFLQARLLIKILALLDIGIKPVFVTHSIGNLFQTLSQVFDPGRNGNTQKVFTLAAYLSKRFPVQCGDVVLEEKKHLEER